MFQIHGLLTLWFFRQSSMMIMMIMMMMMMMMMIMVMVSGGGDDEDGQDEKWDGGGFGVPATDLGSKPADPLARIRRTPRRQTTCPHCLDQAYTLLLLSSMQGSCFSEWTVTCDPPGPAPIRVPSRWRIFHVLHGPSLTNPRISHLTIRYEQPLPQL